jgi:predicted ArsR family transcriptional regulator
VTPVERLWTSGRNRFEYDSPNCNTRYRRRPSTGIAAVLLALHRNGPGHGGAIARAAGQGQGNTTALWLPKLAEHGFVDVLREVPAGEVKAGRRAGGRPAVIWRLTVRGRELAEALADERERAA